MTTRGRNWHQFTDNLDTVPRCFPPGRQEIVQRPPPRDTLKDAGPPLRLRGALFRGTTGAGLALGQIENGRIRRLERNAPKSVPPQVCSTSSR